MLKDSSTLLVEQIGNHPSWSVIGAGDLGLRVVLTKTTVAGAVSPQKLVEVAGGPIKNVVSLDYDNDGVRDLLSFDGKQLKLWRGLPAGTFEAFAIGAAGDIRDVLTGTIGDLDHDGDEDLLLAATTESTWLSNEGGNAGGWQ